MSDENGEIVVPKISVVSNSGEILARLADPLKPYFKVAPFREAPALIGSLEKFDPDVIIVDQNVRPRGAANLIVEQSSAIMSKVPAIIVVAGKGEEFVVETHHIPGPYRLMNLPLAEGALNDAISKLVSESAERSWDKLAVITGKALKLTVDEYKHIADAIDKDEPFSYGDAAEGCQALSDAVRSGNHHDLLKSVQGHHHYTYVHSLRVATLLTLFGHGLGMKGDDLLTLSTGGILHDTGKLVTPLNILDKPGKLVDDEWPIMQNHVVRSGEILRGQCENVTKGAIIIAEQHHEKLDGSGYPRGLKGKEMNDLARMSTIVDIFGALTDQRSYKPPFPAEKAFAILESMGPALDQNLLMVFKDIFVPGSDMDTSVIADKAG